MQKVLVVQQASSFVLCALDISLRSDQDAPVALTHTPSGQSAAAHCSAKGGNFQSAQLPNLCKTFVTLQVKLLEKNNQRSERCYATLQERALGAAAMRSGM
jgi:hypothetical protein